MLAQPIIEAQKRYAQLVVTNAKSILIRNKKVASGRLINSVRYTVNSQGKITFLFAEEGKYVQSGRLKHPGRGVNPKGEFVANLKDWIRQKGIQGRSKDGRFITNQSLAYLIARGINRKGIKPLPFMSMAIKQTKEQQKKELKKAATKSVVTRLKAAS